MDIEQLKLIIEFLGGVSETSTSLVWAYFSILILGKVGSFLSFGLGLFLVYRVALMIMDSQTENKYLSEIYTLVMGHHTEPYVKRDHIQLMTKLHKFLQKGKE